MDSVLVKIVTLLDFVFGTLPSDRLRKLLIVPVTPTLSQSLFSHPSIKSFHCPFIQVSLRICNIPETGNTTQSTLRRPSKIRHSVHQTNFRSGTVTSQPQTCPRSFVTPSSQSSVYNIRSFLLYLYHRVLFI